MNKMMKTFFKSCHPLFSTRMNYNYRYRVDKNIERGCINLQDHFCVMRSGLFSLILIITIISSWAQQKVVVFQSDFGLKDGAVASMKGVAFSVSSDLKLFDLTHEIPAYNIWEAAYRLNQSASYWPSGTVFVSVVDPGVGSARRSIVMKTKTGHYFVTPDNGTLTFIAESLGIAEVRIIDETKNRLRNSEESYTFYGRDLYAFTAARLAAGVIDFQEVGMVTETAIVQITYQKPTFQDNIIKGTIDILDVQYGNLWTNIDSRTFQALNVKPGDLLKVQIYCNQELRYEGEIILGRTFADVPKGQAVAYMNSLNNLAIAINTGDFAENYSISSGPEWSVSVSKKR